MARPRPTRLTKLIFACLGAALVAGTVLVVRHRHAATTRRAQEARVVQAAADLAYRRYSEAERLALDLERAIERLGQAPTPATLEAVRVAWRRARVPYQKSEVFRFWGGPIDRVEVWLNTWPIDEGILEAEDGQSGLLDSDLAGPLDVVRVRELNLAGGETSVTSGWHAIEFVLWGRDSSLDAPGQRGSDCFAGADPRAKRRLEFLRASARLLVLQLHELAQAWSPARADNFRAQFLLWPPRAALRKLVLGLGSLAKGELAGERLTVAILTRDPENEHSCFSDETSNDLAADAEGIADLCLGAGLCDLDGPSRLRADVIDAREKTQLLPQPFDRALGMPDDSNERRALFAARDAWLQVGADAAEWFESWDDR